MGVDETTDPVLGGIEPALRAAVVRFLEKEHVPGAAVGIVRDGRLAWSFGAGVTSRVPSGGTDRTPDADTLFRIASITKTFTATAILRLRDAGRLRLDDPLVQHVPAFAAATNPFGPIEDVTIRRLLTHTSGLQGEPPGRDPRAYAMYRSDDLLAVLGEVRVVIPPDSATKYCNLGFELLGEVVSRVAGRPYRAVIEDDILGPSRLSSTTFDPGADAALQARRATGYDPRDDDDASPVADDLDSTYFEADGGLWSTVRDLATWLLVQTAAAEPAGPVDAGMDPPSAPAVLAASTLREAHRPWILWTGEPWTLAQGLGWYTVHRDGADWTGHGGSLDGFRTNIELSLADGLGIIVLLNTLAGADDLSAELARIALPAHREHAAATRRPAAVDPPEATLAAWRACIGTYVWPAYGERTRVEIRGGRLVLFDVGAEDRIRPLTPTSDPLVFIVEGGRMAGEPARFLRGPDGQVEAVNLGGYPMSRLRPAWTMPKPASPGPAVVADPAASTTSTGEPEPA